MSHDHAPSSGYPATTAAGVGEAEDPAASLSELRRLNQQLTRILEHQPLIPYSARADGHNTTTYIGSQVKEITGYSPELFLTDPSFWRERLHPEDRARIGENIQALFRNGHHRCEYRWRVADGSYRWLYDCMQLVPAQNGEAPWIIGTWMDITERKQAQERLQAQTEFLHTLIDAMPDMVYALTPTGEFTLVNKTLCNLLGVVEEECLGKPLEQLFGPYTVLCRRNLERVRQSGAMVQSEDWIDIPEGGTLVYDSTVVPTYDQAGELTGFIFISRDVTDRRKEERELEAARARAEAASQAKSEFLANMSHEIRTPLNAILGYSQLLSARAKAMSLPAHFVEFIDNINLSGHNLSEIINNILDLSKIEEGKASISEEPLSLALLSQGIYNITKMQAVAKGIEFIYSFDRTLPKTVYSDRAKLNQILMNLISNAIKFTPAGKQIELKLVRRGNWLLIEVADQGIGISEDKQEVIFDAFIQADSTITRSYGGTGLGLAITKRLVELLGGQIELTSAPGRGTTFSVELPMRYEEEEMDAIKGGSRSGKEIRFSKQNRILVVEDNPLNQRMMQALFHEFGLDIHLAGDGKSGVARTIELRPTCVFMDLHMPGMDGLEATRQIRQLAEFADVPIIALSADAFTQQQEVAFRAGVTDYLTKPILLPKLLPILEKYLLHESKDEREPILDLDVLKQFNPSLVASLSDIFVDTVPGSIDRLKRHWRNYDSVMFAEEAHNLKNSGMGIHSPRFTAVSSALEIKGRNNDWSDSDTLISKLERIYTEVVSALAEFREARA